VRMAGPTVNLVVQHIATRLRPTRIAAPAPAATTASMSSRDAWRAIQAGGLVVRWGRPESTVDGAGPLGATGEYAGWAAIDAGQP